ncbi:hypothetical protein HanHA300_Chr02g0050261 [Helianthus annuus]|uniref:Uncharacterized protein n=1 Tax=Helianthus annuus TaxID=4232 RepID=A0A251VGE4_HELAN|nr:hypothetical protein HanHA300_Chr02g0050261 [Helianthus annuus]KAJ0631545.1 hypothetical protein HanLR1_Chr17g0655091 [Helianthus annuus]
MGMVYQLIWRQRRIYQFQESWQAFGNQYLEATLFPSYLWLVKQIYRFYLHSVC